MSSEEFEQKCNDEECNDEEVKDMNDKAEKNPEQSGAITTPSTSKIATSNAHFSHSNFTNDPDIERDAQFLGKFQQIMTDNNTSKLLIFYISQFGKTYQKARSSIKKRTETKASNPEALTLRGKCPNAELFLVRVFLHLDRIRRFTE